MGRQHVVEMYKARKHGLEAAKHLSASEALRYAKGETAPEHTDYIEWHLHNCGLGCGEAINLMQKGLSATRTPFRIQPPS